MVVSEGSGCEYCLRSHMMLGTRLGKLDAAELELDFPADVPALRDTAAVRG